MSETTVKPSSEPSGENEIVETTDHAIRSPQRNDSTINGTATEYQSQYPPMPNRTLASEVGKYAISFAILAAGSGIMYFLYLQKEPPKDQVSKELVQMVGTVDAATYTGQLDKVISGTVVPYREIKVAAEISGVVQKKYEVFEAGNFVKKGTKLMEIDPTDYKLQLLTGLAEVEQSQKMLEETEEEIAGAQRNTQLTQNEFDLAQADHDRNTRIRNALSSSELDQSKRNLLTAQTALTARKNTFDMLTARVKRLEASLALSNAQLERTRLNLEKTTIVAPDDGVIVREMVQEGDFVRAGDQLVTFEDTSRSEVICNLTPTDLAWVRENSPASAEFDNENPEAYSVYYLPKTKVSVYEIGSHEIVWEGILERFDGIGRDESTRTIPCRITIEKPVISTESGRHALVRGMYVKCKIQVQTSADSAKRKFISFPAVALRPGNEVWTVKDNKLKRHVVEVVDYGERLIDEDMIKIVVIAANEGSIKPGDTIVTTPLAQPSDGAEVILESEVDKRAAVSEESAESDVADAESGNESPDSEPGISE